MSLTEQIIQTLSEVGQCTMQALLLQHVRPSSPSHVYAWRLEVESAIENLVAAGIVRRTMGGLILV